MFYEMAKFQAAYTFDAGPNSVLIAPNRKSAGLLLQRLLFCFPPPAHNELTRSVVFRLCNTDTLVWSDVKVNRVSSLQLCNRRQINSAWSWSTVHERCWSPATTTWEQGQVSISKVPRRGQLFHLHQAWEWTKGAHWWKSSSAKSHHWTPKVSLLTREHGGHWNYFVRDAPFIILGFCWNILVWSFFWIVPLSLFALGRIYAFILCEDWRTSCTSYFSAYGERSRYKQAAQGLLSILAKIAIYCCWECLWWQT